ncbi:MAG TPA: hypothetical protein VLK33_17670 [Terriglobales bacterium]|nr:hypothetical protein [Terriglobales bacterium]
MNFFRCSLPLFVLGAIVFVGLEAHSSTKSTSVSSTSGDTSDDGVAMTVEGLVRDVACPMQNHKSTATHFSLQCAVACARTGSPLVILTKNDEIYFPMTDQMPDVSQREKLMPYVGKFVRVTGQVRRRNGTRTIVIRTISELKNVKLDQMLDSE